MNVTWRFSGVSNFGGYDIEQYYHLGSFWGIHQNLIGIVSRDAYLRIGTPFFAFTLEKRILKGSSGLIGCVNG